jgi:photosystem II stability/assembly factor-like uncharacterized protein
MTRLALLCFCFTCLIMHAQQVIQTPYQSNSNDPTWIQLMYSENPNVDEIRQAYDDYYSHNDFVKNADTQYYKRWTRMVMPYITDQGEAQIPMRDLRAQDEYLAKYHSVKERDGSDWEEMGPWHFDPEVAMYFEVQSPGACHVYTVEQSPSNPDIVWAGTATAGIWKSTDKGMHWELMSRDLLVTSVYSIAIHPSDPNIVYFGEGNGTIYKTTDGGSTWNMTGDEAFQSLTLWCRDLKFKPGVNQCLIAATNNGLRSTQDAGASWNEDIAGEFMEIEFHPTSPDIIYTVRLSNNKTMLMRSIDGGDIFTNSAIGWPEPVEGAQQRRCEISVSAAAPDRVYVLASGEEDGGSGLYGIYLSEDSGENFTFQCCGDQPGGVPVAGTNPNTLGWSEDGSGEGGQFYYDLGLDVSPTNPELLYSAGINVWRSENAGGDWSLNGHWVTWAGEFTADRYTHADVHDVKFFQNEDESVDMWVASDGGLFYSSNQGDNIEPRMYGMHGTDFWGWQSGARHGSVMVGGTYHNGTLIRNGNLYHWGQESEESGGWLAELGGDNFRGFVNPGDSTIGYYDSGAFKYTTNRFERVSGQTYDNTKRPNTSYWWGEYGNMEWSPECYSRIYSPVETELWTTNNGGATWELVHDFGGSLIVNVKVAPRDPNVIYVTHNSGGSGWKIWRTADGGENWIDITPDSGIVGGNNGSAKYIDVHGTDPNVLFFVILGTQSDNKIFKTSDGGESWDNLTGTALNGQFTTSIAHQRGTDDGLYVGTDFAVYYRNGAMADWELYNANLPAKTPSVFLQNNYCEGKVRSAGSRGVHQCDFYEDSDIQAAFTASKTYLNLGLQCKADTIRFVDNSIIRCAGASFSWTFEGADPATSEELEPLVTYASAGTYDVSLTINDGDGNTDTWTWDDMIEVVDEPVGFPLTEDFNNGFPPENWKIFNPEGGGSWEQGNILGEDNQVAQFPNYWVGTEGQTDLLIMPAQDFTDVQNAVMTFDMSYQVYDDYIDGLAVVYQTEDNDEWITLYEKEGTELAVVDNYVWFWYDQEGTLLWREETVDLSALSGESCVTLAFANIGGNGNHIWIDNVNLEGATNVDDLQGGIAVNLFPNPANNSLHVQFPSHLGLVQMDMIDAQGKLVNSSMISSGEYLDIEALDVGMYFVQFKAGDLVQTEKIIIQR